MTRKQEFSEWARKAGFRTTLAPEPHAARRAAILRAHPEVRKLFGYDPSTAWITLALVVAQLGQAYGVQLAYSRLGGGWKFFAFALLWLYSAGAIGNHWLTMVVHETSHNLALRTRAQNKMLALFANIPAVLPMAMTFHHYHLEHHIQLGVDRRDSDLPHWAESRLIGHSSFLKFIWVKFYVIFYLARGPFFAEPPDCWEWLNLLTQMTANYLIWHWLGPVALISLGAATFVCMSHHPVAAHFIHEHYIFDVGSDQETYSYYGPLNRVTFNVGYHNEHHDLMWIPGSRLPRLREMAPEFYEGLLSHRSWTMLLIDFIRDKRLGPNSRIVRSSRFGAGLEGQTARSS